MNGVHVIGLSDEQRTQLVDCVSVRVSKRLLTEIEWALTLYAYRGLALAHQDVPRRRPETVKALRTLLRNLPDSDPLRLELEQRIFCWARPRRRPVNWRADLLGVQVVAALLEAGVSPVLNRTRSTELMEAVRLVRGWADILDGCQPLPRKDIYAYVKRARDSVSQGPISGALQPHTGEASLTYATRREPSMLVSTGAPFRADPREVSLRDALRATNAMHRVGGSN